MDHGVRAGLPRRERPPRQRGYNRGMRVRLGIDVPETELAALCVRNHVRELALFGSSARGDHRPDSDVDVLVEFFPDAPVGLVELASLQMELTQLLGAPVDLVPKDGLKRLIRGSVLREAKALYAA